MNAPAKIAVPRQCADDSPHTRAISIHCPNCSEMEMAARVEIATLRDRATAAAPRASQSAGIMLAEIARIATFSVFAPMSASELLRIRAALILTMMAAREIERVTRNG